MEEKGMAEIGMKEKGLEEKEVLSDSLKLFKLFKTERQTDTVRDRTSANPMTPLTYRLLTSLC